MTRIALSILVLLLVACGGEPTPPAAPAADTENPAPEHFLSEQQKALERAKKLQEEINASVEKRLEEVDRQTRDDRDQDQQ